MRLGGRAALLSAGACRGPWLAGATLCAHQHLPLVLLSHVHWPREEGGSLFGSSAGSREGDALGPPWSSTGDPWGMSTAPHKNSPSQLLQEEDIISRRLRCFLNAYKTQARFFLQ